MKIEKPWSGDPLSLHYPVAETNACVFSSPHSGRVYTDDFRQRSRLSDVGLRLSEDAYVDQLFRHVPTCGATLIAANFPRAYVDVNRNADELDAGIIKDPPKDRYQSLRVAAGLGVIPRIVKEGRPIYRGKLSYAEVQARLDRCYHPFHETLKSLLKNRHEAFGTSLLIDCHSMPSEAYRSLSSGTKRAEVVIGDCHGVSCDIAITEQVMAIFENAGFKVARNMPFAGGYITQRYGRPRLGYHALQIEIDRALYLDEARMEPSAGFFDLQQRLKPVVQQITALMRPHGLSIAAQ